MTPLRNHRWHPLLTAVLVLFLGLTAWSIDQARRKVSTATDPDYLRHGLRFDDTELERRALRGRDWALAVALEGRQLTVRLHDGRGRALTGGRGELVLPGLPAAVPEPLVLVEETPGLYRLRLPDGLAGTVTGRLSLELPDAGLQRTLVLNL